MLRVKYFIFGKSFSKVTSVLNVSKRLYCISKSGILKHIEHKYIVGLEIIGCGGGGSPGILHVKSATSSYLFNGGESTQRIATEFNYKISRINNFFITTPVWKNIGGLPGLIKSSEVAGKHECVIHAPEGTMDFLKVMKNFITYPVMNFVSPKLKVCANGNHVFSDNILTVEYVPLARKQIPVDPKDMPVDKYTVREFDYGKYKDCPHSWKPYFSDQPKKQRILDVDYSKGRIDYSLAYICKFNPSIPKVDVEKCVELGITPGPNFHQILNKNDVILPDGKLIRYQDVLRELIPEQSFIVIDCYDESVLESLLKNTSFDKCFIDKAQNKLDIPICVIHFTPEHILQNPMYKKWMLKFGPDTRHLIINEQNKSMVSLGVNQLQRQLNLIHPNIFPILADEKNNDNKFIPEANDENNLTILRAKNNGIITFRPKYEELIKIDITDEDINVKKQDLYTINDFQRQLDECRKNIQKKLVELGPIQEYPKVTMLGTGSGIPGNIRNTSSILLQINENSSLLLDTSEGTFSQMVRLFGEEECNKILSTIKGIYVSHLHADHHLGLIAIMQERHKFNQEPLYLFAPTQIMEWLKFYNAKFEETMKYFKLVSNKMINMNSYFLPSDFKEKMLNELEIMDIRTTDVLHCANAFGVAITFSDHKKMVYSGDTLPSNKLIVLGKDCDLLIHEATFEDELKESAKLKKHSTFSEAIVTGKKMRAKNIILTHFSQRYVKIPRFNGFTDVSNVGYAYDNMQVRFDELPLLPLFHDVLTIMFSDYCREYDIKESKRQELRR